MGIIRSLSDWLDRQGDLMTITTRLFLLGPALLTGTLLTLIGRELTGFAFWIVAALCACACGVYYAAFFKAFVRQRERFYQTEVRPRLAREYRDD